MQITHWKIVLHTKYHKMYYNFLVLFIYSNIYIYFTFLLSIHLWNLLLFYDSSDSITIIERLSDQF